MKFINLYITIGLLAAVLTACGTGETSLEEAKNGTSPQQENVEPEKDSLQEDNNEETDPSDTMIRLLENNLTYTLNGETKEQTAFLKHSDNQGYSMYILPDYELTAEEPNKDVVMLSNDGEIFMRVELLPKDVDWDSTEQTAVEQLQAVASEVNEINPPELEFFANSKVYEARINEEVITSYLVKNNEGVIKLTSFTKESLDYRDSFIKMAETIVNEAK
ncbi:hypothetical protein ACFFHF_18820 [Robertmurraya beringensis]|uniref:Lipoprotein n=1 Tax=Robertmurraya beringensis TaxID=641660 RepID=A0ABV6KZ23_9BACI